MIHKKDEEVYDDGWLDGYTYALQVVRNKFLQVAHPHRESDQEYIEGYKDAITELKNELENLARKHSEF